MLARPWLSGQCVNHMYLPAEPYLSPAAAEVSSRGWPPRAMAARARLSYAVTSAVELSGVVTVDIKGVVATPALEGVSGVSEERPRRKFFRWSILCCMGGRSDGERSELRRSDPTFLRRNESGAPLRSVAIDRKSTRLNSSHP